MSTPQGTILKILQALVNALQPLDALLADSDKARDLLIDIGVKAPVVPQSIMQIRVLVQQLSIVLIAVEDLIENQEESSPEVLVKIKELGEAAASIFTTLQGLSSQLETDFAGYPDLLSELDLEDIVKRLVARLFIEYLKVSCPVFYNTLNVFGVIGARDVEAGQEYIPAYTQYDIHYERIKIWLTNPNEALAEIYGWGDYDFDYKNLFGRLQYLLLSLGFPNTFESIESNSGSDDNNTSNYDAGLHLPLYTEMLENAEVELSGLVSPTIPANQVDTGILFTLLAAGQVSVEIELTSNVVLKLGGSFDATGGTGLEVRPPFLVQAVVGPAAGRNANAYFEAEIIVQSDDQNRLVLFEQPGLFKLDISGLALKMGMGLHTESDPTIQIESRLIDGLIAIGVGESDGFLKKILPENGINGPFELGLGWRGDNGIYFEGSGGFELTIPVHASIGPINLESIYIALTIAGADDVSININVGVTANAELGPISANIQRVGVKSDLSFPGGGGNIGPANIDIGFLPPTGAGLALDTGFVVGGGYLEIDRENERYAGILELKIGEIGVVAIGLIATRMPDGSKGFSLLINIGVTFSPPIQLSFGFVLSGVGGLLGYNRTMLTDVLREGLKNKTLESILFPENPIANASKIISDCRSVFPVTEGQFVIGPMIKLCWGSPPLITVDIGIFIEMPSPVRIVLLGQIAATFPSPDLIIVEIHIDVLGIIDFGKKELSIDASIYDSSIYGLVLNGDAALRLSWGDNPVFIVSLGGFHPRFSPPPSLTSMKRLSLSISESSLLQIHCWTYQALTTNSLQFGAGVELHARAAGALIEGGMSFDALIYFNPFSFSIDMAGHLVASYKGYTLAGVYLSLGLSGPSPWNARGTATFEILFWDISVDFNVTWGPSDNERLPAIDPWLGSAADNIMGLQEALSLGSSWGSRLPAYANMFEALKEIEEVETDEADSEKPPPPMRILMHPFSRLEIQQKVLPFNLHLEKLGNNPVRDHNDFRIESVVAHGGGSTLDLNVEPLLQDISRGQYKELNKIQRLTLPSFEKLQVGILAGSETVYFAQNKSKHTELVFESILINPDLTSSQPDNPEKATTKWHDTKYQMRRNAIRQSGLVNAGRGKYATAKSSKIQIQQEGYYVVKTDDLSLVAFNQLTIYDHSWPNNDGNLTRVKADELMDIYLQENQDAQVQVISVFEYEEAA